MRIAAASVLLSAALLAQQPAPTAPTAEELAHALGQEASAVGQLLRHGPAAATALVPFLTDPGKWGEQRQLATQRALLVLLELRGDGHDAVPALIDCLEADAWAGQRAELFAAIAAIGVHAEDREDISGQLGKRCDRGKYFGQDGFFECLSKLTFDARAARPAVLEALQNQNAYVREIAAETLAQQLRRAPPDAAQREQLARDLREALAAPVPDQFNLTWKWNDSQANTSGGANHETQVHSALALALSVIEPAAPESVPGHARRLHAADPQARIDALRALGGMGEAAAAAVPAMIEALQGGDPLVAREAATMLGSLGKVAAEARPALAAAAASADKQLAARAAAALKRLP